MHARQNTVEAFAIAIEHGADGVELDVRRTRDGAMIVHHEERAVPKADPFITQDLKAIKAATPWVPTLDEAWAAIGDSALMNIEIKNKVGQADFDQTRRIAGQVVEWIEANAARDRVLVSSFDGIALKAVRDRDPGIHTGLLATIAVDPITAIEWAKRDGNFSVNLPLATVLGDASRTGSGEQDIAAIDRAFIDGGEPRKAFGEGRADLSHFTGPRGRARPE